MTDKRTLVLRLIALLLGLIFAVMTHLDHATATLARSRWVDGYYVGYLRDRYPISEIEWSGLSHLFIGRILPSSDGSLNLTLDVGEQGPELTRSLIQAAHAHGKKAIAFIGGEGLHSEWLSAARRATFVRNLVALVKEQGFDGIDLDWEPLEKSDRPALLALVKDLRSRLPNAILTFPADGFSNINFPTDRSFYAQLAPYLDQINLMTYGSGETWQGWQSWHSSPLYQRSHTTPFSIDNTVQEYLKAGVPAHKLGIGVGFFGTCWSAPVRRPNQAINGAKVVASDNVMSFTNILQDYYSPSARNWDATAQVPYLSFTQPTGPQQCTFISYEDERSLQAKADYVAQQNLGGVILWNINQGYIASRPKGERSPLLCATRKAFLGRGAC